MNEELVKAYKQSNKFLALISSEYGKEMRENNPELVKMAQSIAETYLDVFIRYRMSESEVAQTLLKDIDEFGDLLDILPQTSYESIADVKNELEAKAKLLQGIMSFQPSTFYDKYFLNNTSTHLNNIIDVKKNPRFKVWFSGSKVMDADKNPLVVYHGTGGLKKEFNSFNFKIFPATYFAENKSYGDWFANIKGDYKVLLQCYLRVLNPIDLTDFGVDNVTYNDFITYIELKHGYKLPDAPMLKAISDKQGGMWAWRYLRGGSGWIKFLKSKKEFDGFHYYENNPQDIINGKENITKAWMIFEPNQIKTIDSRNDTYSMSSNLFSMGKGGHI